jgi:hypothetical protein
MPVAGSGCVHCARPKGNSEMKKLVQAKVKPTTYDWLVERAKAVDRTLSAFVALILDREKEKETPDEKV